MNLDAILCCLVKTQLECLVAVSGVVLWLRVE